MADEESSDLGDDIFGIGVVLLTVVPSFGISMTDMPVYYWFGLYFLLVIILYYLAAQVEDYKSSG